jgi:hypothetical protein
MAAGAIRPTIAILSKSKTSSLAADGWSAEMRVWAWEDELGSDGQGEGKSQGRCALPATERLRGSPLQIAVRR